MSLLFYPQKSHRRASAEANKNHSGVGQFSVPLGPSAGDQGAKISNISETNKKKSRIFSESCLKTKNWPRKTSYNRVKETKRQGRTYRYCSILNKSLRLFGWLRLGFPKGEWQSALGGLGVCLRENEAGDMGLYIALLHCIYFSRKWRKR